MVSGSHSAAQGCKNCEIKYWSAAKSDHPNRGVVQLYIIDNVGKPLHAGSGTTRSQLFQNRSMINSHASSAPPAIASPASSAAPLIASPASAAASPRSAIVASQPSSAMCSPSTAPVTARPPTASTANMALPTFARTGTFTESFT
eukprot:TRINITY_DN1378_c0_g1_i1.p1 TRINITY_DN1378_c0_g1~~TRINITY_DN1378_c0_g1_i1.p1  ORF type:complete len:145 (-),score=18.04 TRINITY_DN1378_c0_g1_i1:73-507(-)